MTDLEIDDDGRLAVVTLTRAHGLDAAGKAALTAAVTDLASRDELRALIVTHRHREAFLVDVAELADMTAEQAARFSAAGHVLARKIETAPFPVIAAVDGPALGGGCELVLACDLAVAGTGAQFGQIEAMGGVMPAFGGTWRLPRRDGLGRALELMFTGAVIDAATARSIGLVLEVTDGRALDAAKALAARIAPTSRASVAAIKETVRYGYDHTPGEIDAFEEQRFAALFGQEQSQRMHAYLGEQAPG